MTLKYSMLIRWSEEDQKYIVTLPEFGNAKTHGETYEEAAREGSDLIESFLMWKAQDGEPLPKPNLFVFEDEDPALATSLERAVG